MKVRRLEEGVSLIHTSTLNLQTFQLVFHFAGQKVEQAAHIVAALGNRAATNTRHNIGFMLADLAARRALPGAGGPGKIWGSALTRSWPAGFSF